MQYHKLALIEKCMKNFNQLINMFNNFNPYGTVAVSNQYNGLNCYSQNENTKPTIGLRYYVL